jgi:hypothetical protein
VVPLPAPDSAAAAAATMTPLPALLPLLLVCLWCHFDSGLLGFDCCSLRSTPQHNNTDHNQSVTSALSMRTSHRHDVPALRSPPTPLRPHAHDRHIRA